MNEDEFLASSTSKLEATGNGDRKKMNRKAMMDEKTNFQEAIFDSIVNIHASPQCGYSASNN